MLRSQVTDLINWALRSDDGWSYEDDEPDAHSDPMRNICQLQPDGEHYEKRILERRNFVFEERTDLMNRLTGTPHERESDWRVRNVRTIFNDNQSLRVRIVQGKEEIAHAVTASTCSWIPEPCLGDLDGYLHDHGQPQSPNYHTLLPQPRAERCGGCV
jgi:hypothetical protein